MQIRRWTLGPFSLLSLLFFCFLFLFCFLFRCCPPASLSLSLLACVALFFCILFFPSSPLFFCCSPYCSKKIDGDRDAALNQSSPRFSTPATRCLRAAPSRSRKCSSSRSYSPWMNCDLIPRRGESVLEHRWDRG
jgi:hypothetical protein